MKNKEKGITLIALIITIIVMLILVAVTIAVALNGEIFNRAHNASDETQKATDKEVLLSAIVGTVDSSGSLNITEENMKEQLKSSGNWEVTDIDDETLICTNKENNNSYLVYKDTGKIVDYTGDTTYTVTFKDGEETLSTQTVNEGATVTKPTDPTKEEYDFVNWYSDSELTTVYDFTSAITGNTTIYAKWIETATPSTAKFGDANPTYANDFGKIVTGYGVGDKNEATITARTWRLFYADSNYAYLISDSIGNYALNNTSIVKGFGTSTISTLARNYNSIYDSKGDWTLKTDGSNLNNNINAVAALLDTTQWIDYESTDAEWAVGAPTLEMFVASYNATHSDSNTASDLGVSNHTIACDVESDTSPGYKVKLDSGSFLPYISNLGKTANLDKAIYCGYDGCWWLASPGVFNGDGAEVMHTYTWNDGQLYTYAFTAEFGIRPLVCVPISKIGEEGSGKPIIITSNYFNN